MNRARLDAEQIRDALLAISGQLDVKMGGPSVQQFQFKDDHSPVYDYARYELGLSRSESSQHLPVHRAQCARPVF